MTHRVMGVLEKYDEHKFGWALDLGYRFASYEAQLARFATGQANESDTIETCNDIIASLTKGLSRNGIARTLEPYERGSGDGQASHQHATIIESISRKKSDSHAAYYIIGTAIGKRHSGFSAHTVEQRIKQISVWFPGCLESDPTRQQESLYKVTEADCSQSVLPEEPFAAKVLLRALSEPRIILFVSSDPVDEKHLANQKGYRVIKEALASSKFGFAFKLEPTLACRSGDLGKGIRLHKPAYIHFSGHGGDPGLVFENENGKRNLVNYSALASIFKIAREEGCGPDGVFFNACYTAEHSQAIANSAGAFIGMHSSVTDAHAIKFAEHFYRTLGGGSTFEMSFKWAIAELEMNDLSSHLKPCYLTAQLAPEVPMGGDDMPRRTPSDSESRTSRADRVIAALSPPVSMSSAIQVTRVPGKNFTEIMFSPCSDYFITLNEDGIVSMWDSDTGGHVSNLLLDAPATAVTLSPEKNFLACAVKGKGVFLASWDSNVMRTGRLVNPKLLTTFPSELIIVSIALSNEAKRLAVVSRRGMERTYRIANSFGKVLRKETLTAGRETFCNRVAMSPDGKALAYAHAPDLLAAEFPSHLRGRATVERTSSMFSDIRDVVALREDHAFIVAGKSCDKMYSVPTQMKRKTLSIAERHHTFTHVVASSDDSFIMVGDEEGVERIQLTTPKASAGRNSVSVMGSLENQPPSRRGSMHFPRMMPTRRLFMAQKSVRCMALSPHNDQLIAASSSGLVKIWNLKSGRAIPNILMGQEEIYGGELWAISPSSPLPPVEGREFISASPSRVKGGVRSSSSMGVKKFVRSSSSMGINKIVRSSSSSPVKEEVHPSFSSPVKKGAPSASSSPIKEGGLFSSCSPVRNKTPSSNPSPVKEAPAQEAPVKAVGKLTIQTPDTHLSDPQSPDTRFY